MKVRNDDWLDMDSREWTEKEKKHISELIRLQSDTIKAQQDEITKLKDTLALSVINSHNLIDSTYKVMDNEIKLLRGLLEQWLKVGEPMSIRHEWDNQLISLIFATKAVLGE